MDSFFRRMFGFDNNRDIFDDDMFGRNSDDPLSSMHNFIQEQINDILEQFNFEPHDFNGENSIGELIEPHRQQSLRQMFLKPGYQDTCQARPNADIDLDDRIEKRLPPIDDKNSSDAAEPKSPSRTFTSRSQTIISRTIRQPDGTYVTERITRDQDGNEEKTVTVASEKDDPLPSTPRNPFRFF